MTSEVVLMNRQGVAMAADSAVTISGANYLKTYQSVDKLFPLVDGQPIAVMIYSNAEIMSTPWETVISLYREQTNGKAFETLDEYTRDFMSFLSGNPDLFSSEHQDTEFLKHVAVVFYIIAQDFDREFARLTEAKAGTSRDHVTNIFEFVVNQLYHDYINNINDTPRGDLACFPQGTAEQLRRRYKTEINELIETLIEMLKSDHPTLAVSPEIRERLFNIAIASVIKDAFFEHYTGIVFAGFGKRDKFPSMRSYLTSSVVLGILKHRRDREADMSSESGPVVQPFAQDRMIKTFLTGMDQHLRMFVFGETLKFSTNLVADIVGRAPGLSGDQRDALFRNYSTTNLHHAVRAFFENIDRFRHLTHTKPIYRAIQMLPKKELGETAASLIKLNSFQQKVMHSVETVGGPIDVALITRNGGLEWRKEKPEL